MEFQTIVDFLITYVPIALQVVGVAAVIAAATPNKVDDKIVQFLLNALNFLGGNLGNAANKED